MNKKIMKFLIGIPPISGLASAGVVVAKQFSKNDSSTLQKQEPKVTIKNEDSNQKISIFPKIHNEDFYSEIKVKNGVPFFDDEFIAKVINYVIAKTTIADGKIAWNYRFLDNNHFKLAFRFEWRVDHNVYLQPQAIEYLFELSKN